MKNPTWTTIALLAVIAALFGLLLARGTAPVAHAESSEGRAGGIVALTSTLGGESLLYLVDTEREVILVYGYHTPGSRARDDLRSSVFEFLAGRLYRWDALLATRNEYSLKGLEALKDLRVLGKGGTKDLYERANR